MKKQIIAALLCVVCVSMHAQEISLKQFRDGIKHWFDDKKLTYVFDSYSPEDYKGIADNIVAWQNPDGGWPKNINILGKLDIEQVRSDLTKVKPNRMNSTLDNRNTYPQIEYLSIAYKQSGDKKYMESARKGMQYIFDLQDPSGGWRGWDVDAITYNDEVTTGAMETMFSIINNDPIYDWVDADMRAAAAVSLDRAIDVTLRCQIVKNGEKTVWCQQHNHKTLEPQKARSYEFPSLCPAESGDILMFLMQLENPSDDVKASIRSAIKWIENNKITGIEVVKDNSINSINERTGKKGDVIVKENPNSTEVYWARFYDLDTEKPFFARRDGTIVQTLAEVEHERRTGYSWYTASLKKVLSEYKKWEKKNS